MKVEFCDNQHGALIASVDSSAATGLSVPEDVDHLRDSEPQWQSKVGVLRLVGESDRNHGLIDESIPQARMFVGCKFAQRTCSTKGVPGPAVRTLGT